MYLLKQTSQIIKTTFIFVFVFTSTGYGYDTLRPTATLNADPKALEVIISVNHAWRDLKTAEENFVATEIYKQKLIQLNNAIRQITELLTEPAYDDVNIKSILKQLIQEPSLFWEIATRLISKQKGLEYTQEKMGRFRKKAIARIQAKRKKIRDILYLLKDYIDKDRFSFEVKDIAYYENLGGGYSYFKTGKNFKLSEIDREALELFDRARVFYQLNRNLTSFGLRRLLYLFTHPFIEVGEILERQQAIKVLKGIRERLKGILVKEDDFGTISFSKVITEYSSEAHSNLSGLMHWITSGMMSENYHYSTYKRLKSLLLFPRWSETYKWVGDVNIRGGFMTSPAELHYLSFLSFFKSVVELRGILASAKSAKLREIARVLLNLENAEEIVGLLTELADIRSKDPKGTDKKFFIRRFEIGMRISQYFKKESAKIFLTMQAIGELDAYLSLAMLSSQDDYKTPKILDDGTPRIIIKNGHNPYIYQVRRNESKPISIIFTEGQSIAVITGPQESGKSTLSQTVTLDCVLAQIGSDVPAADMEITPLVFSIAIDPQGSQERGISHAKAQLIWGKQILDLIKKCQQQNVPFFYIADEVFCGINSYEKTEMQIAYLVHLAGLKDFFAIFTTQDLDVPEGLQNLRGELDTIRSIRFYHFQGKDPQTNQYPHILQEGVAPAKDMNAVEIAVTLDYPSAITTLAKTLIEKKPVTPSALFKRENSIAVQINQAA